MSAPQPRTTDGKGVTREEGKAGGGQQRTAGEAINSTPTPTHSLQVATSTVGSASSATATATATAGLLSAAALSGADEQPSSARSDSAAFLGKGRAVSGADKLTGATAAADRGVSVSQPVSPAKARGGRSLLLQTLPAQLFSPAQQTHSMAAVSGSPHSVRTSAAGSPSGSASPATAAVFLSSMSAAPPAVAATVPFASAAAASLSPEKISLSPGVTHLIKMANRRKEAENDKRREEQQQASDRAAHELHHIELGRTALSMVELQPRLIALQAERKEANGEEHSIAQQRAQQGAEGATEGGTGEGEHRDTRQIDGEPRAGAAAEEANSQPKEAAELSGDRGVSLPVVVGGLLLLGASVYASWIWYQRQRRRLGIRR